MVADSVGGIRICLFSWKPAPAAWLALRLRPSDALFPQPSALSGIRHVVRHVTRASRIERSSERQRTVLRRNLAAFGDSSGNRFSVGYRDLRAPHREARYKAILAALGTSSDCQLFLHRTLACSSTSVCRFANFS